MQRHPERYAGRLHVSEATVNTHVVRILARLRLRDRAQAVIAAYETGLVTPQPGGRRGRTRRRGSRGGPGHARRVW
ncbi:LuxR C-terminal-related transcriptional regulator [Streptomyces sp. NPDC058289]|uniref:LuxR C-terminal-related transcriptional regulator n=1 Tax=Streptomyces sp. NPDC058289 TaxID=3346425 RepID=UPI0036ECEB51